MILEVRRYEIVPGRRDEFVEWFDTEVLPEMERTGMRIVGQFVSRDDPDVFFYLRAFADEGERRRQTAAFYGSERWESDLKPIALEMETSYHVETVEPTARSRLT